MSDDFRSEMMAAIEADAGDEATPATPIGAPDAPDAGAETQPSDGDEGTTPTPEPESESGAGFLQGLKQKYDPALVDEIYRYTDGELKRGLTPKLQKLSELEQQYEGVDPQGAAFLRQVQELATWNPQAAQQLWEAGGRQVFGQTAPPQQAPAEPEPEPEFYSDRERELWLDQQRTKQELAELRAWRQQETHARNMAQINEKFARLESEIGRSIPTEERNQVARWCMQQAKQAADGTMLLPEVDMAWKYLNWDKARAAARSEAAGVVERKAGISPGPSAIQHAQAPPREPQTRREAIAASLGLSLEDSP